MSAAASNAATSNQATSREAVHDILREARVAQAAHFDALTDLRDAQTLRLYNLKEDVAPALDSLPKARDFIDLALVPGDPPKLWVDLVSYVVMAPDPRSYRLVRDTSEGPAVLFETADRTEMTHKVVEFIAHRAIERERRLAATLRSADGDADRRGYSGAALWLAWLSGFAIGVLALLALGLVLADRSW